MPLPLHQLLGVELTFLSVPIEPATAESYRAIALSALNYAGSLGRVVSFVSTAKIAEHFGEPETKALLEDLDSGLFTVGELQSALCDHAYMCVEELFTLLTAKGRGVESAATGSANPNG